MFFSIFKGLRIRRLLVLAPVLTLCLGVGLLDGGSREAEAFSASDEFYCWYSGNGEGLQDAEFMPGNDVLVGDGIPVSGILYSLDAFTNDIPTKPEDRILTYWIPTYSYDEVSYGGEESENAESPIHYSSRADYIGDLFFQAPVPLPDHWESPESYLKTWSTANQVMRLEALILPSTTGHDLATLPSSYTVIGGNGGISSVSAQWVNLSNPLGGYDVDEVRVLREQQAAFADIGSSTHTIAAEGNRIITGAEEGTAIEISATMLGNCTGGATCSFSTDLVSAPTQVTTTVHAIDQTNLERFSNQVSIGARKIPNVDPDSPDDFLVLRTSVDGQSYLPLLSQNNDTLTVAIQEDSDGDSLNVVIELDPTYRADHTWDWGRFAQGNPNFEDTTSRFGQNAWPDRLDEIYVLSKDERRGWHAGFEQPQLGRAFGLDPSDLTDLPTVMDGKIRWPVYLKDLNWYLVGIPEVEAPELAWRVEKYWRALVYGGYSDAAVPSSDMPFNCSSVTQTFRGNTITCDGEDAPGIARARPDEAYFPFDAMMTGGPALSGDWILKAGTVGPSDETDARTGKLNNRFEFRVLEGAPFSEFEVEASGLDIATRYGVPTLPEIGLDDPRHKRTEDGYTAAGHTRLGYLSNWPNSSINPNRSHLLLVTFYEVDWDRDWKSELQFLYSEHFDYDLWEEHNPGVDAHGDPGNGLSASDTINFEPDTIGQTPAYKIRRVICRMMVHAAGARPTANEDKGYWENRLEPIVHAIGKALDWFGGLLDKFFGAVAKMITSLARKTGELTCAGLGKLDSISGGGFALSAPTSRSAEVGSDGTVRPNAAAVSRHQGLQKCVQVNAPEVLTCDPGADAIFRGRCVRLPQLRMFIESVEQVFPAEGTEIAYRGWRFNERWSGGGDLGDLAYVPHDVKFVAPQTISLYEADPLIDDSDTRFYGTGSPYNVGLTQVKVSWDFLWSYVDPDLVNAIDGYVVIVNPGEKVVGSNRSFDLTKTYVLPEFVASSNASFEFTGGYNSAIRVEGFRFGALGINLPPGSDHVVDTNYGGFEFIPGANQVHLDPIGADYDYDVFNAMLDRMPIAPGFHYKLAVAPYIGIPHTSGWSIGPVSDVLEISGSDAACFYGILGPDDDVEGALIADLFSCAQVRPTDSGYIDDGLNVGLLGLVGTDICTDIFSSTPAALTWDNPVVKDVWRLVQIIAGSVLLSLLMWQGLRMTYDTLLDPQPALGFRQLVPRFLIAIILAAISLWICKITLIMASDLTCFIAQATGTTMWGVVGNSVANVFNSFLTWENQFFAAVERTTIGQVFLRWMTFFVLAFIVVVAVIFIMILFITVTLGMLLRIALLAVLTALSPLAFAFYASDATAHWTKRWVSMFLGATFQQVLILIVIFMGYNLLNFSIRFSEGTSSSGTGIGFTDVVLGLIMGFLTLALAVKIPNIVNPAGQGVFDSFKTLGTMAFAGAVVGAAAVTAGAAAPLTGAARGALQGARSGWQGGSSQEGGGGSPGGSPSSGPGGSPISMSAPSSSASSPMGSLGGQTFGGAGASADGPTGGGGAATSDQAGGGGDAGGGGGGGAGGGGGGDAGGGGFGGALRGALGGAGTGARSGIFGIPRAMSRGLQRGSGMNTRMRDIGSGAFLYRHGSKGDDAAQEIHGLRNDLRQGFRNLGQSLQGREE